MMVFENPEDMPRETEVKKWLNPIVLVHDIYNSKSEISPSNKYNENNNSGAETQIKISSKQDKEEVLNCKCTPSGSVENFDSDDSYETVKKKQKSWDPNIDYEIEKILGHMRDDSNQMWYYVKWKDWSEEYNTYEPLENLTGCHYLLLKYFESKRPPLKMIKKMKSRINSFVDTKNLFYRQLMISDFSRENLMEFSKKYLNIDKIFQDNTELQFFENILNEEYNHIVRCVIAMSNQLDEKLWERAQYYNIALRLVKLRRSQLYMLSLTEKHWKSLEETPISIVNNIDFHFRFDFEYVNAMVHGSEITVPLEPPLGCNCPRGCQPKSNCCGIMAGFEFAYHPCKKLRIPEKGPIYECNQKCKCSNSCPNRVVQHGRKIELCVFKTESCGWGVKTLEKINKGKFVCEYIGELITESEAVRRDFENHKRGISYLFDLDFNPDHESVAYCIDTMKYGNISRFINHSCDPNLVVYPVWIDCLEPNLPRLAFFAKRNIGKGEEITFDYDNRDDSSDMSVDIEDERNRGMRLMPRIRCKCNSSNCRKWLFGGIS